MMPCASSAELGTWTSLAQAANPSDETNSVQASSDEIFFKTFSFTHAFARMVCMTKTILERRKLRVARLTLRDLTVLQGWLKAAGKGKQFAVDKKRGTRAAARIPLFECVS